MNCKKPHKFHFQTNRMLKTLYIKTLSINEQKKGDLGLKRRYFMQQFKKIDTCI